MPSTFLIIRAKRVSNCYIQTKKKSACSTNLGFSGGKNCACVRLILVLVLRIMYQIRMYLLSAGRNLYVRTFMFRPWTHTSDDSYIYQLSLVVATATVSFIVCLKTAPFNTSCHSDVVHRAQCKEAARGEGAEIRGGRRRHEERDGKVRCRLTIMTHAKLEAIVVAGGGVAVTNAPGAEFWRLLLAGCPATLRLCRMVVLPGAFYFYLLVAKIGCTPVDRVAKAS